MLHLAKQWESRVATHTPSDALEEGKAAFAIQQADIARTRGEAAIKLWTPTLQHAVDAGARPGRVLNPTSSTSTPPFAFTTKSVSNASQLSSSTTRATAAPSLLVLSRSSAPDSHSVHPSNSEGSHPLPQSAILAHPDRPLYLARTDAESSPPFAHNSSRLKRKFALSDQDGQSNQLNSNNNDDNHNDDDDDDDDENNHWDDGWEESSSEDDD
jgi:hypothetical protein